jgi:hypothetical protein
VTPGTYWQRSMELSEALCRQERPLLTGIGVRGPVNRLEVVSIVSTLVGNRHLRDCILSGRKVEGSAIVQSLKEGHWRGVLLVPEESLGPLEPRQDSEVVMDLVIEELRRAFSVARENGVVGDG